MYACTYDGCGTAFKKEWRLVEHMVKHTGKKPFLCTESGCDKSFGRKSHLQRHIKNHSQKKDFQCPEDGCQHKFVSRETLNHHRKRVHMDKPFKCSWPDCGKTFKKHQWLKSHTSQHTGILPHVCDYEGCHMSFAAPCKLRAHKKTHQGYSCDIRGCEVIVYKWTDLRKHKHMEHSQSIPCEKCDKTFSTKAKLRVHSKTHAADRQVFECPHEDCSRTYTRVSYLQQHVSNYHEGARPYACSHTGCVKTFAYKRSLLKHQVVHEPGYCKPPSNPKRKRTLASRLSGFLVSATGNISSEDQSKEQSTEGNISENKMDCESDRATSALSCGVVENLGNRCSILNKNSASSQSGDNKIGNNEMGILMGGHQHMEQSKMSDATLTKEANNGRHTTVDTSSGPHLNTLMEHCPASPPGPSRKRENEELGAYVDLMEDDSGLFEAGRHPTNQCSTAIDVNQNDRYGAVESVVNCSLPGSSLSQCASFSIDAKKLGKEQNMNRPELGLDTSSSVFNEIAEVSRLLNLSCPAMMDTQNDGSSMELGVAECHTDRLNM